MQNYILTASILGSAAVIQSIISKNVKNSGWLNWIDWNEKIFGGYGAMYVYFYYYFTIFLLMSPIIHIKSNKFKNLNISRFHLLLIHSVMTFILCYKLKENYKNYNWKKITSVFSTLNKKFLYGYLFFIMIVNTIIFIKHRELFYIGLLKGCIDTFLCYIYGMYFTKLYGKETMSPRELVDGFKIFNISISPNSWTLMPLVCIFTVLYSFLFTPASLLFCKKFLGYDFTLKMNYENLKPAPTILINLIIFTMMVALSLYKK